MSGVYGPIYKAEINVHKQVPDSLQWSHRGSSFDNTIQAQKAVTLGDYIYVFAQQDNGAAVTSTHINDGGTWTPLQALPENMLNADYSSAMAWGTNYTYLPTMTCTVPLMEKAGARLALTPNSRS